MSPDTERRPRPEDLEITALDTDSDEIKKLIENIPSSVNKEESEAFINLMRGSSISGHDQIAILNLSDKYTSQRNKTRLSEDEFNKLRWIIDSFDVSFRNGSLTNLKDMDDPENPIPGNIAFLLNQLPKIVEKQARGRDIGFKKDMGIKFLQEVEEYINTLPEDNEIQRNAKKRALSAIFNIQYKIKRGTNSAGLYLAKSALCAAHLLKRKDLEEPASFDAVADLIEKTGTQNKDTGEYIGISSRGYRVEPQKIGQYTVVYHFTEFEDMDGEIGKIIRADIQVGKVSSRGQAAVHIPKDKFMLGLYIAQMQNK